jgi:hypothetical protein
VKQNLQVPDKVTNTDKVTGIIIQPPDKVVHKLNITVQGYLVPCTQACHNLVTGLSHGL